MSASPTREIVLVRHAETEWSRAGRHTGRTDIPLTDRGRAAARALARQAERLALRACAREPAATRAGNLRAVRAGRAAEVRDDLAEWDYGEYEGLTTAQIQAQRPGWSLWRDGCPGGESATRSGRAPIA